MLIKSTSKAKEMKFVKIPSMRCQIFFTVKLQIFVRYLSLFSYFRLETGSYVLIFVLSRVCEENDVEIQWLQSKKKFSYDIKFRTFSKVRNVRK